MKHFFEKCGSLLLLALAAVFLLFAFSPAANAASTRYSDYSLIDVRVNADPGEDPHLKLISGIEDYSVINYQDLSSESLSSGDRQEMLRGHGSGDSGAVRWHSRVNPKLTVIMQAFFLTLRR